MDCFRNCSMIAVWYRFLTISSKLSPEFPLELLVWALQTFLKENFHGNPQYCFQGFFEKLLLCSGFPSEIPPRNPLVNLPRTPINSRISLEIILGSISFIFKALFQGFLRNPSEIFSGNLLKTPEEMSPAISAKNPPKIVTWFSSVVQLGSISIDCCSCSYKEFFRNSTMYSSMHCLRNFISIFNNDTYRKFSITIQNIPQKHFPTISTGISLEILIRFLEEHSQRFIHLLLQSPDSHPGKDTHCHLPFFPFLSFFFQNLEKKSNGRATK